MKQFITFLRKEFAHVLRDRKTLLILFGMPIVQILIFGFALTNEVTNARIVIMDQARDDASQKIISKIEASRYFEIEKTLLNPTQIERAFQQGNTKLAIIFPTGFAQTLVHDGRAQVQVIADASDPNTATTLTNYVTSIIQDYQQEMNDTQQLYSIRPEIRMLYNPQ